MTLSNIVFNFYPNNALMIILLALLNDILILAIAYDNTRINPSTVRWKMSEVLTIFSVLGISGVVSSFVLFYILKKHGFPEGMIQTLLFLKLVIAGHRTLYVTRTEGWFWHRPWLSPLLFCATFGTEIVGTIIAVFGVFITPISWKHALLIWGYHRVVCIQQYREKLTCRFVCRNPFPAHIRR